MVLFALLRPRLLRRVAVLLRRRVLLLLLLLLLLRRRVALLLAPLLTLAVRLRWLMLLNRRTAYRLASRFVVRERERGGSPAPAVRSPAGVGHAMGTGRAGYGGKVTAASRLLACRSRAW